MRKNKALQKNRKQYGSLVKRLRRRPLTAETGVRFPYELFRLTGKLIRLINKLINSVHLTSQNMFCGVFCVTG